MNKVKIIMLSKFNKNKAWLMSEIEFRLPYLLYH